MRKIIFILTFFFLTISHALEIEEILKNIQTDNITGKFTQTKYLQNFKNPLLSSGTFSLKNGVFQQDTTKPLEIKIKVNKSGVYEYNGREYQKIKGLFDENLFLDILSLNITNLKSSFDVTIQGDKQHWTITLKPKNFIAKIFESITLSGSAFIQTLTLTETNKDITRYEFFDVR